MTLLVLEPLYLMTTLRFTRSFVCTATCISRSPWRKIGRVMNPKFLRSALFGSIEFLILNLTRNKIHPHSSVQLTSKDTDAWPVHQWTRAWLTSGKVIRFLFPWTRRASAFLFRTVHFGVITCSIKSPDRQILAIVEKDTDPNSTNFQFLSIYLRWPLIFRAPYNFISQWTPCYILWSDQVRDSPHLH